MKLERSQIREMLLQGISPDELFRGIEIIDQESGLVGITKVVKVHSLKEKRNLLYERTKILLSSNSEKGTALSSRNILQQIGGGPLKRGEWIQVTEIPTGVFVNGTRGVHKLDR